MTGTGTTDRMGYRRRPREAKVPSTVISSLAEIDTTDLSDVMAQAGTMVAGIRCLLPHLPRMAGNAVTLSVPAGASAVRREAIAMTRPGDVLVMDARGATVFAVLGGNLARDLAEHGVVGAVVDGCIRDAGEIEELGLPVFMVGQAAAAAPRAGSGEVNVPIACGGVVVRPGDVVVGDRSGVVVVPAEHAREVADAARTIGR
jgi:4-hydroxy-4-methyl-2-oxoglutarate aldolase